MAYQYSPQYICSDKKHLDDSQAVVHIHLFWLSISPHPTDLIMCSPKTGQTIILKIPFSKNARSWIVNRFQNLTINIDSKVDVTIHGIHFSNWSVLIPAKSLK